MTELARRATGDTGRPRTRTKNVERKRQSPQKITHGKVLAVDGKRAGGGEETARKVTSMEQNDMASLSTQTSGDKNSKQKCLSRSIGSDESAGSQ